MAASDAREALEEELQATRERLTAASQQLAQYKEELESLKSAEARQRFRCEELDHRLKNFLAAMMALAKPPRDTGSLEVFSRRLQERLQGLMAAQALLSNADSADLRKLLSIVLCAHTTAMEKVTLEGQAICLTPTATQTLSLVFNELATNAAKYGALADPNGKLHVFWHTSRVGDADGVSIEWSEVTGHGPPGAITGGFGTMFIKRSIEHELGGRLVARPEATGLRWLLEFPQKHNIQ